MRIPLHPCWSGSALSSTRRVGYTVHPSHGRAARDQDSFRGPCHGCHPACSPIRRPHIFSYTNAPGRPSLTASNAGVRGSGECSRNPDRLLAKKFSKIVLWGMRRHCAVRTLLSLPEEVRDTGAVRSERSREIGSSLQVLDKRRDRRSKGLAGAGPSPGRNGEAANGVRASLGEGIPEIPKLRSRTLKVFGAIEVAYHQFTPGEIETLPFKGPVVNLHLSAPTAWCSARTGARVGARGHQRRRRHAGGDARLLAHGCRIRGHEHAPRRGLLTSGGHRDRSRTRKGGDSAALQRPRAADRAHRALVALGDGERGPGRRPTPSRWRGCWRCTSSETPPRWDAVQTEHREEGQLLQAHDQTCHRLHQRQPRAQADAGGDSGSGPHEPPPLRALVQGDHRGSRRTGTSSTDASSGRRA